jgi:hypothetical protein
MAWLGWIGFSDHCRDAGEGEALSVWFALLLFAALVLAIALAVADYD